MYVEQTKPMPPYMFDLEAICEITFRGTSGEAMLPKGMRPARTSEGFANQLQERLTTIEKRDWELWILALLMVGILTFAFFFVIYPAVFMGQQTFSFQAGVSSQLLIGLLILILLFIFYLVQKHMEVRSLRARSMVEAVNLQLARSQLLLDPLTQTLNRSSLEAILEKEIKRVQRSNATMVFLYIDVNDFKNVNSRFGHLSGDLVLTEVAAILKSCVRGSDYVIRMGGDEFLVALVETEEAGAQVVKQRINLRTQLWNQDSLLDGYTLSLSVGIGLFDGTRTFDEVLSQADANMYAEKRSRSAKK